MWPRKLFGSREKSSAPVLKKPRTAKPSVEKLEDRVNPVTGATSLAGGSTMASIINNLKANDPGVQITNVVYRGANSAIGEFTGGANSIGLDKGVVLSSGAATSVVGPNTASGTTTSHGTPGDADLNIVAGPPLVTRDAAVLEFDFRTTNGANLILFKYVFASEEYPEFVAASFNDAFALYLNGTNVTFLPGTSIPVTIDNVNAGANAPFFVVNTTGAYNTEMDGFTVPLTVFLPVQPGVVNRFKIAIADVTDTLLDSNVFIDHGSFRGIRLPVTNPPRWVYNAKTRTYDGPATFSNPYNFNVPGPVYVVFNKMPAGVTLTNPTGYTASGKPYIALPGGLKARTAVSLPLKLSNPKNVPLNTSYITDNVTIVNILN